MASSSLLLRVAVALLACASPSLQAQQYSLKDDYNPTAFFDMFNFDTEADPTHGFVQYIDQPTASNMGLISNNQGYAQFGADHTNVAPSGRSSIRLQSKAVYTHGLFVADFQHTPGSVCGSWPAFWTFGPNWPYNGEIDILEGVNSATSNLISLHSGPSCSISGTAETGTLQNTNCDSSSGDTQGCNVQDTRGNSFGTGLNNAGGGTYAMEWTSAAIKIWFFPRGSAPGDILSDSPNPDGWGNPVANFQGACDIDSHFANHQITFDMTFCGDWAGNVFAQDGACSSRGTCSSYVANNPNDFADVYFAVNALKVYQMSDVAVMNVISNTSSSSTSSSSSSSSSSSFSSSSSLSSSGSSSSSTSTSTTASGSSASSSTSSISSDPPSSSTSDSTVTSISSSASTVLSTSAATITSGNSTIVSSTTIAVSTSTTASTSTMETTEVVPASAGPSLSSSSSDLPSSSVPSSSSSSSSSSSDPTPLAQEDSLAAGLSDPSSSSSTSTSASGSSPTSSGSLSSSSSTATNTVSGPSQLNPSALPPSSVPFSKAPAFDAPKGDITTTQTGGTGTTTITPGVSQGSASSSLPLGSMDLPGGPVVAAQFYNPDTMTGAAPTPQAVDPDQVVVTVTTTVTMWV